MTEDIRDGRPKMDWAPRVCVKQVIEVVFLRGKGDTDSDPVREVTAYHDLDGARLAEHDPFPNGRR